MIYRSYKAQESTISALTLISSSLMLLSNIIGRLYLIIIKCKNLPPSTITDNDTISNSKNLGDLELQECENNPSFTTTDDDTIYNPKNLGELEFQECENLKNA